MKTMKYLMSLLAVVLMLSVTSCKDEEDPKPEPTSNVPVKGTDFDFTVNVNTVTFTTTLTSTVIFNNATTGSEHTAANGSVEVFIAQAGTYPFVCSNVVGGTPYVSDTFNVVIENDDLSFLNEGLWLHLTGGAGESKTWRMDMNSTGVMDYFDGPMYFSGYEGATKKEEWSYWAWDVLPTELPYMVDGTEMTGFFNWSPDYAGNTWLMPTGDYGTISFTGDDFSVETTIFGETKTGTFTFDPATWKLGLTDVILPTDTTRLNEGQYLDEDLANVRIFSLSDSAMQIGIKRTYEGKNDDGTQKESKWVNVYNFVVDDYTYVKEQFTAEPAPKTSITAADLEGTWKIADIPMGWIGFTKVGDKGTTIPARLFEKWNARTDVVATLEGWGLGSIDSLFTAQDAITYVFNADGTCTLNGVANNYTVADGIITFTTALTEEFYMATGWLSHVLTGTEVTVIDVNNYGAEDNYEAYTPEGIWIGQKATDKTEYNGFQLVKQP